MTSQDRIKIEIMKEGGRLLASIIKDILRLTVPGRTTKDLNDLSNQLCKKNHVKPAFLGFNGYPASLCTSINDIVVHGIPDNKIIREGDLIGIDFGIVYKGYNLDSARTKYLGTPSPEIKRLLKGTFDALNSVASIIKPNKTRIGDIGAHIQAVAQKNKLGIIRELSGHGVGRKLQEEPSIPNFGESGTGMMIRPGMTVAIEPMLTLGADEIKFHKDGWSIATKDCSLSAHFEDTFAILDSSVINLTGGVDESVDKYVEM